MDEPERFLPLSTAGLLPRSACVKVGPPLFCNGPSFGSMLIWSALLVSQPSPLSLLRLYPNELTVAPAPGFLKMFAPETPAFRIVPPILTFALPGTTPSL